MNLFSRTLRLARSEKGLGLLLSFCALGIATAQVTEPILFGRVIDSLSKSSGFGQQIGLWTGLGLLNASLSIFVAVMADRFAHRQRFQAMGDAFQKTIALPYSVHSLKGSGKVVRTIISGSDLVFNFVLSLFRENMTAILGVCILVPMAFWLEPKLAIVLCALAMIYACSNYFVIRKTQAKQAAVELRHQDVAAQLVDVIGNVTIVRSFTRLNEETTLFRRLTRDVLSVQYPVLTWWGLLNTITRLSSMFAMVTIVAIGSYLVRQGAVSPGRVVTFVGFSTLLIGRLDQISSFIARVVSQAPTLKALFDVIDHETEVKAATDRLPAKVRGHVEFENVTFQYRTKGQGVFNLNFEVQAGETVALVGPSGSGKTTALSLLQRLYTPSLGQIFIDGLDIQDVESNGVCGLIASVFQDAGLFNRSIYENILVGRPSATREEVEYAAVKAHAHEFILSRPGGYDFVVGERGLALSGGERQRIAIARAILKNAPILVLDEATSALDNETEKKVQMAMDRLRTGRTTFVIAHRLSTIANADRVLVMNQGRIVESGSFKELQESGGLFSRLLKAGELGGDAHAEVAVTSPAPEPMPMRLDA